MMQPVELLRQNLATEPDLQGFIGFVMESVGRLGGNLFAACPTSLAAMEALRGAGAGTGYPLEAGLVLDGQRLRVQWGDKVERVDITAFAQTPEPETVEQLRRHLLNSTESVDPAILLQRNAKMARHLEETRVRTEKELKELQQALETRQKELHDSLRAAETDPLTGLFNRRAFDEKLGQAFRRTMRQRSESLSLVLLDLDYFKQINDQYGHQVGDEHLKKMARILRGVIREDVDFAFRFGGDEFALLVFAGYSLACEKAREVLQSMENKVSIGITAINRLTPDGLTLEQFIHHADNALYQAKRNGRGQIAVDPCPEHNGGDCGCSCPAMASADSAL